MNARNDPRNCPRNDHCLTCPTRQYCVGAELDEAELLALGACVRPSAPLRKGDYLYRAGDPAEGCFVVRSGTYKRFSVSATGEEHVTGFHYPGDVIGLAGLATGRQADSAIALETATACRVRNESLPVLWSIGGGASLLRLVGEHEERATEARIGLTQSRADCRVARFLLDLSQRMARHGRSPDVLPAPMSRTDLASYLGMTLESLSRVFSRLSRAGLISATRTEITLHSRDQLESIAYHFAD